MSKRIIVQFKYIKCIHVVYVYGHGCMYVCMYVCTYLQKSMTTFPFDPESELVGATCPLIRSMVQKANANKFMDEIIFPILSYTRAGLIRSFLKLD